MYTHCLEKCEPQAMSVDLEKNLKKVTQVKRKVLQHAQITLGNNNCHIKG